MNMQALTKEAWVYLPYGYDAEREQPYRTIYVLHGGGQDESDWLGIGSVQNIIDNLKSRKPVIVNMEELDVAAAQRILDFISGAIYAINGTIAKISRGIFVVAPTNYDVIGNENGEYEDL